MTYSPRGSLWHRWDLHFHTPSSFDYENKSVTDEQIVAAIQAAGIRVVAVTDHHIIDVARLERLQALAAGTITFLPGIELRDDHGDKPVHYISIFPEDCDLEHVWTTLQGKLGLTAASVAAKGGDQKVYVPIEDGARTTRELGGIISIHAGAKANSIEGIKNVEQFQQRIKFDITKQYVDLMEIGQLKDVDSHLKTIFPKTGLYKPLVRSPRNRRGVPRGQARRRQRQPERVHPLLASGETCQPVLPPPPPSSSTRPKTATLASRSGSRTTPSG